MAFLVNDTANHFCAYLLCAFHKDALFVVGHLHGVETYYLTEGIGDGQILETGGYGEVFQFVVDEIDGSVGTRLVQVFQHFR